MKGRDDGESERKEKWKKGGGGYNSRRRMKRDCAACPSLGREASGCFSLVPIFG